MKLSTRPDSRIKSANGQDNQPDYKELLVWQKGMDLVVHVYLLTGKFPNSETYGLKSQLQRAAVSVPSNIAEGRARGGAYTEFSRYIRIALGSLAELDTQLELSIRLGYLAESDAKVTLDLVLELRKMLFGLLRKLR